MKGWEFFTRTNSPKSWNLISYHHPHSITWRFYVNYTVRQSGRTGPYFMRIYCGQGFNFMAGINLPLFGSLSMKTQPHMWEKQ